MFNHFWSIYFAGIISSRYKCLRLQKLVRRQKWTFIILYGCYFSKFNKRQKSSRALGVYLQVTGVSSAYNTEAAVGRLPGCRCWCLCPPSNIPRLCLSCLLWRHGGSLHCCQTVRNRKELQWITDKVKTYHRQRNKNVCTAYWKSFGCKTVQTWV